jgi:hypothetical protein
MVAERFYIGAGEKALVAGCKRSDFEAWLKRHPVMLERIDFLSEDDIGRKDSISGKYKGVLFCRHINHPDNNKIEALAKKAGIIFTRFFPRPIELKTFLEMSVPIVKGRTAELIEISATQVAEIPFAETSVDHMEKKEGEEGWVVELRKPKKGEVQGFVLKNANFSAEHSSKEVSRLFQLATEEGLKTTEMSVEVAFYRVRRLNKVTDPNGSAPKDSIKKSKDKKKSVLYKYLDFLAEFSNNSLVAGQAIRELLAKVESFDSELSDKQEGWNLERIQLTKENAELKKENQRFKADIARIAKYIKN